jgi:predicted TIM-barrel fold metal-dependent hydrolase
MAEPYVYRGGVYRDNATLRTWLAGQDPEPVLEPELPIIDPHHHFWETPKRGMFESNFPPDKQSCTYLTLWNAFKRIAAGASADERTALFSGTAAEVYRL